MWSIVEDVVDWIIDCRCDGVADCVICIFLRYSWGVRDCRACFVFGKSRVRILARRLGVLVEVNEED